MISTQPLYLRMIMFATISLFLLFTFSCKKDPISSNPISAVATSTIGSDGGTLETEDFSLYVPAGSFQNEATLSLSISADASIFGDNSASQTFIIDGLPDKFDKQIRLSLKYIGTLSDSSYIAFGSTFDEYFNGDSSNVYQLISAKDSAGFLIGYLSTQTGNNYGKIFRDGKGIDFVGDIFEVVSGFGIIDTDHFTINYPKALYTYDKVHQFGLLFEELRENITFDLGFKYNLKSSDGCSNNKICWHWPRPVTIKDVEGKVRAGYRNNPGGPFINTDGILMGTSHESEARVLISQILFAISMGTYQFETYYLFEKEWLARAIFSWLEEYFDNTNNSQIPTNLTGNELAAFYGMQVGNSLNAESHGNGMVSIVKYLVDTEKIVLNKIGGIFNTIHEQNIHPVAALLNNVNALVADWWPDFFEKLISGDIYNINSSVFMNSTNLAGTWDINSDSDTLKVFTESYPDLSAKRFIVNLNHSDVDSSASLYLDATEGVSGDGIATLVFGLNSNTNLEHLVTAKGGPVIIPNLKNYYDNGIRKFLVVVVNSTHNSTDYLGTTNIDLTVKVDQTKYNRSRIWYKVVHNLHEVINESDGDQTIKDYSSDVSTAGFFEGDVVNNIFNGSYQADIDGVNQQWTMTAELNDDKNLLESFSMTYSVDNLSGTTTTSVLWSINGANLIKTSDNSDLLKFKIDGENTCNYITLSDFTSYSRYEGINNYWKTWDVTTTSYSCDANSFIEVQFWNE